MKANYVAHLSDPARFVQVVPITHAPTLSKIHQTYRLSYLKDVMLARIIDDPTYTMLNSFIFFHQIDIVQHLQQDHRFLSALFALFEQPSDPYASDLFTKQREAILLLHQFCTLAKNLQLAPRQSFYRSMSDKGLLRALEVMLQRTAHLNGQDQSQQPATEVENAVRVTTIEILMMLIEHHPNSVRSYCLRSIPSSDDPSSPDSKETEQAGRSLVSFLIALLNTEEDLGIQAQMTEAIKVLAHAPNQSASDNTGGVLGTVDSGKGRQEDPEAERFLQYLYDHCISALFQPLLDLTDPNQQPSRLFPFGVFSKASDLLGFIDHAIELSCGRSGLCAQLCDLLVHFIGTHTFRSKYFVLSTPVCSRVARLFRSSQKHLSLGTFLFSNYDCVLLIWGLLTAAIRFYKATLVRKDDFYNRYLAKHDLIKPILDVAVGEVGKDNLVASACLDFFEHIRINNTKPLLNHIMEEYSEVIKSLAESETVFQLLVMKWEQNNEPPPEDTAEGRNVINRGGPYGGRQTGTLEAEEESYFNDSSSGEDDEEGLAHDGVEPRPELSPAVQMPTSKKRKIEDTRSKKRQRTDSAPTLLYAAHPSPSVKGSIVRSPALVFQEMAVKGSQRRARSNTSASAPAKPLVSYGEGDDEPKSPDTLERPGTPTLSKRLPEYPSTPPNVVRPRKSEPPDIHSTLGSPFQSIDDNIGEREDTEPRFSREGPPPSLKSLGEKRRREEEEDDVLANVERKRSKTHLGAKSSAAPSATNGSVAATTTKSKGGGFASGLTKLKLNFGLGGGSSKKSG